MGKTEDYSKAQLEMFPYRFLQQKAKSLNLPSNVKKVYLVELIFTKKFGTPAEVDSIIQHVRKERQQSSLLRQQSKSKTARMRLQAEEISSTSILKSPPITVTPKRTNPIIVRCSPLMRQNLIKYNRNIINRPKSSLKSTTGESSIKTYSPKTTECQRVLRNRTYPTSKVNQNNEYRKVFNFNNTVIGVMKGQNAPEINMKALKMTESNSEVQRYVNKQEVSVSKCVVRHRPSILSTLVGKNRRNQSIPMLTSSEDTPPVMPAKRKRELSGIYPIETKQTYTYIQGDIGYRNNDGTYSKISALVQKPQTTVTLQISDVNSSNEIEFPLANAVDNPRIDVKSVLNTVDDPELNADESQDIKEFYSKYCHKKIRAEQVRSRLSSVAYRRDSVKQSEQSLPRIHEVFSIFNNITEPAYQPTYAQVPRDTERLPYYHMPYTQSESTYSPLEMVYNYRITTSVQQTAKVAKTYCVYTTPLVVTAMVHNSTPSAHSMPSYIPNEVYHYDNYHNYLSFWEQDLAFREMRLRQEVSSATMFPTAPRVGQGDNMHDALELISQDGDYMERIGMDERISCPLCEWAGPSMILEHHIRNEHRTCIERVLDREWSVTLSLGAASHVGGTRGLIEREGTLYLLAAVCRDGQIYVTIQSISETCQEKVCSITMLNKVTGEPYRWSGPVPTILDTETTYETFRVELSKLNLLPNSANLKLVNSRLVLSSPCKVVCGRPELDDIFITIYVNL